MRQVIRAGHVVALRHRCIVKALRREASSASSNKDSQTVLKNAAQRQGAKKGGDARRGASSVDTSADDIAPSSSSNAADTDAAQAAAAAGVQQASADVLPLPASEAAASPASPATQLPLSQLVPVPRPNQPQFEDAPFKLRPYQIESIQAVLEAFSKGISAQMVMLPTGCGKTVIFAGRCSCLDCPLMAVTKPTRVFGVMCAMHW